MLFFSQVKQNNGFVKKFAKQTIKRAELQSGEYEVRKIHLWADMCDILSDKHLSEWNPKLELEVLTVLFAPSTCTNPKISRLMSSAMDLIQFISFILNSLFHKSRPISQIVNKFYEMINKGIIVT